MTAVTAANIKKHNAGDQIKIVADLSNIQNNYTWIVPHLTSIEDSAPLPTTEADLGATISGNTMTFKTSSTIAAKIAVYGR